MLKWIIYDLGETLVGLSSAQRDAMRVVATRLKELGHNISVEDLKRAKTKVKSEIDLLQSKHAERWRLLSLVMQQLGLDMDESELRYLSKLYDDTYVNSSVLYPGAREILIKSRTYGFKNALLSDGRNEISRRLLRRHGIEGYFDVVFTSEDLGKTKIDGAFLDFCRVVGCEPKECLVVGNDPQKDGAARRAGMYFCCVNGPGDFTVRNLAGVESVLHFFSCP